VRDSPGDPSVPFTEQVGGGLVDEGLDHGTRLHATRTVCNSSRVPRPPLSRPPRAVAHPTSAGATASARISLYAIARVKRRRWVTRLSAHLTCRDAASGVTRLG
jgi:hypothetical protein